MPSSRIIELAQLIASQTAIVDSHIHENNLPQPSFDPDGPIEPIQKSTTEVENARTKAVEATIELRQLLEGSVKLLLPEVSITIFHCHDLPRTDSTHSTPLAYQTSPTSLL